MTGSEDLPPPWTLPQLSERAAQEIRRRNLPSPGNRVSHVPTARAIRYYTTLGLLDKPLDHAGGVARYGERHLLQLLALKALQGRYLPLPDIQAHLLGRSAEELARIVDLATPPAPAPPTPTTGRPRWSGVEVVPGLVLLVRDAEQARQGLQDLPPQELGEAVQRALRELLP